MSTPHVRPKLFMAAAAVIIATMVHGGASARAAATASIPKASQPYCGITWGSLEKSAGQWSPVSLVATRTGRHECYDRVVFEFTGQANGYQVGYTSTPAPWLDTAGGAVLRVKLLAPTSYPGDYPVTYPHQPGDHVADVRGYRTLRDVVWDRAYDEGSYQTSFGIFEVGVRARLPFRVFVLPDPYRIVVDIAHRW